MLKKTQALVDQMSRKLSFVLRRFWTIDGCLKSNNISQSYNSTQYRMESVENVLVFVDGKVIVHLHNERGFLPKEPLHYDITYSKS